MARDFDRHFAEFRIRIAGLNSFKALDVPITEVVRNVFPGQEEVPPVTRFFKHSPSARS